MSKRRGLSSGAVVVLVFTPAAFLAEYPLAFVIFGLQALGASYGLWVGDPTVNDGEEYWAWPVGLIMLAILFGLVVLVLHLLGRRTPLARWVWPVGLLIIAAICLGTFVFSMPQPIWAWSR